LESSSAPPQDTHLNGPPPAEIGTPRAVVDGEAPAELEEALHVEGLDEARHATDLGVRLRRAVLVRPVDVDLCHGGLEDASCVAWEAHVRVVYWLDRERLALLDEGWVDWVGFDGGRVGVGLPDWCGDGDGEGTGHAS